MLKKIVVLLGVIAICIQCKKKEKPVDERPIKPSMNTPVKHKGVSPLSDLSEQGINNWTDFYDVNDFLKRFKNTSPTEALTNAIELKDLTKTLKDSISLNDLQTPSFKARLNVLENETLRLADMTTIPAITSKEVNDQIDKILLVFDSMIKKINTIYSKKKFDEEIDLDDFFKVDDTKKTPPKTPEQKTSTSEHQLKALKDRQNAFKKTRQSQKTQQTLKHKANEYNKATKEDR